MDTILRWWIITYRRVLQAYIKPTLLLTIRRVGSLR